MKGRIVQPAERLYTCFILFVCAFRIPRRIPSRNGKRAGFVPGFFLLFFWLIGTTPANVVVVTLVVLHAVLLPIPLVTDRAVKRVRHHD